MNNTRYVRDGLAVRGVRVPETPGPIIPLFLKDPEEINDLKRRLLAKGIHPPYTQYTGGPDGGCFRFVISSEHTRPQLRALVKVLGAK